MKGEKKLEVAHGCGKGRQGQSSDKSWLPSGVQCVQYSRDLEPHGASRRLKRSDTRVHVGYSVAEACADWLSICKRKGKLKRC